jgi:hypothetical protein
MIVSKSNEKRSQSSSAPTLTAESPTRCSTEPTPAVEKTLTRGKAMRQIAEALAEGLNRQALADRDLSR